MDSQVLRAAAPLVKGAVHLANWLGVKNVKGGLVLHSVSVPVWSSFSCEITQIRRNWANIQKDSTGTFKTTTLSCAEPLRKVVAAPLQPFAPSVVDLTTTGDLMHNEWWLGQLCKRTSLPCTIAMALRKASIIGNTCSTMPPPAPSTPRTYSVRVRCLLRIVAIWVPIVLWQITEDLSETWEDIEKTCEGHGRHPNLIPSNSTFTSE